eukprot:gene23081-31398_t
MLHSIMITGLLKAADLHVTPRLNNLLINRRPSFGSYFILKCRRNNHEDTDSKNTNSSIADMPNNWLNWEYGFAINKNISSRNSKVDQLWKNILTDSEVFTGIEALTPFCSPERQQRIHCVANLRTDRVRFVFENPQNVNNVWAALRSLDSFGIQFVDIILPEISETCSQRKAEKRTTMNAALGSQQWLTLYEHRNTTECLKSLKKEGYRLFATDLSAKSKLLRDFVYECQKNELYDDSNSTTNGGKMAIIMGNEEFGISQEARELVDDCFYIPMYGFAESLNLSIATAVVCSALDAPFHHNNRLKTIDGVRSPQSSIDNSRGLLSPHMEQNLKNRIILTWLTRSVRGSMSLLRKAGLPVTGDSRYQSIGHSTTRP